MNYDERMQFLKDWFKSDIVSRFNMPRDLDPTIVAMDVIEAITLPSVRDFLEAMKNTSQSHGARSSEPSSSMFNMYAISAERIRQGNAVSDMYLRDPHRKKLIDEYSLTEKDFEPYDKWFATTAHKQ